jgi:hypothetical protein
MEGNNKLTPLDGMKLVARNLGQVVSTTSQNPDDAKACRIYDTSGGGMHLWVAGKSHDVSLGTSGDRHVASRRRPITLRSGLKLLPPAICIPSGPRYHRRREIFFLL